MRENKLTGSVAIKCAAWWDMKEKLLDPGIEWVSSPPAQCDSSSVGMLSAIRQVIKSMEVLRRDILTTPLPGNNAASKLARGTDATAAGSFTSEDIDSCTDDLPNDEYLALIIDTAGMWQDADGTSDTLRLKIFNEIRACIVYRAEYLSTPRGAATLNPALSALLRADVNEKTYDLEELLRLG